MWYNFFIEEATPEVIKITYIDQFRYWLLNLGVPNNLAYLTEIAILLGVVALLSIIGNFIAKKIILSVVKAIVKKTTTDWDDILLEHKVFHRLSHFAPALIIYFSAGYILYEFPGWVRFIEKCSYIYMIAITLMVINSFINGIHDIYKTLPVAKNRSIKGYIQVVKIIVYLIGAIVIIATLMGRSPVYLLSGLGAFTAILLLIFQDSIKGLVGGIQLSASNMIRLGDWITVSKHNVDGTVIEMSMNAVKVQNADMTISSIPTYTLVNESFQNWRGMTDSGGRRIKRAVNIDMHSIQFCNDEILGRFEKIQLVSDFVKHKMIELNKFNTDHKIDNSCPVNGKRLTNLGVFRKYLEMFLKNNQDLNPEMTFVVRYLDPTPLGLPIEIWVFSRLKDLQDYESVQADIFEHVLTVLPEFGLKVFQNPTGEDVKK
ncbi:MAG: mechanosensitive ion channel [Bacteroidia bacterium]|nr:mechanosensitive ion channel [Bacteroidia bacterium]